MKTVNVRIKYGGQVMAFDCCGHNPSLADWVVVKNGDVTYLGQVVTAPVIWGNPEEAEEAFQDEIPADDVATASGEPGESGEGEKVEVHCPHKARHSQADKKIKGFENRRILRVATDSDMARQAENQVKEQEALEYCISRVAIQRLDMKLVAVEVVFDGSKTIFYYTADERVDFRLLVKELVSRFRTRIEMRQIGVRHEARMIGGLGTCGRGFCCAGFLSNFAPVSVKMAKEQNISLSPSKISGVCGRLMCCLAFEHMGPTGKTHHSKPSGRPPITPPSDEDIADLNEEQMEQLAAQLED